MVVFCSRNAWEWYAELHASRWAQALKGGRVATADIHLNGRSFGWRWWYLPPSTISAVNCKLPRGLIWKMLRVCTVVCVILFVPYSLCLPQQNNETIIPKICGLDAFYQWLLYIHPDLMVTFTSTCHVLSNVYTSFPILWNVWPKKSFHDLWSDLHTHTGMCVCVCVCVLVCFQVGDLLL
jgi:hypothetical protein